MSFGDDKLAAIGPIDDVTCSYNGLVHFLHSR